MLPFILTSIAGLSTLLGTIFIFFKIDINKLTYYSLAFASGVMMSVSLFDLIPESLKLLFSNNKFTSFLYTIVFIILGIIIAYIIDKLIPKSINTLYRVGVISAFTIILHNLPEGIITYLSSMTNIQLGISLTIAIALHNIPEGISIAVPIYSASKSRGRALFYTLLAALAEPIGAVLAFLFLKDIITNTNLGIILSLTAGIMLYISMFELLPNSLKYKNKTPIIFLIGIIFVFFSQFLIS